jgi:hypothetical protein
MLFILGSGESPPLNMAYSLVSDIHITTHVQIMTFFSKSLMHRPKLQLGRASH